MEVLGFNQFLQRAASPSLALISSHDSAGKSGMEPSGTEEIKKTEEMLIGSCTQYEAL